MNGSFPISLLAGNWYAIVKNKMGRWTYNLCSPHHFLQPVKQIVFFGGAAIEALDVQVLCSQPLQIINIP